MTDSQAHKDRFGLVFVLILALLLISASLGAYTWGAVVRVVMQGVILLFALRASLVSARAYGIALTLVVLAVALAAAATMSGSGALSSAVSASMMSILVLATPVAIIQRLRHHERVTAQTVFAALSVYMLIGLFYSTLYGAIAVLSPDPFFAQVTEASGTDVLYFSFVTLSTLGYGDLTPVGSTGRMLAVSEALIGQLYLVTVVALLVGNVGREAQPRREDDSQAG